MIDMNHESSSGDLKPYILCQDTLKPGVHSFEEEQRPLYKHAEVSERNKLGQLLKAANPGYDCEVTSDYDQGFVEKPALTCMISFNFAEAEASLSERETSRLDTVTIFCGVSYDDIKRNKKTSRKDDELKSVEVDYKICKVQHYSKEWEVVEKVNRLEKQCKDVKSSKKPSFDTDDSSENEVEEDEDFKPECSEDCFMAFCSIFALLLLLFARANGKGLKPLCVARLPSFGCIEDHWYRIDGNKTETKLCEGMVCQSSYKKEKNYDNSCSLVLPVTKESTETLCNIIYFEGFHDIGLSVSNHCPEEIFDASKPEILLVPVTCEGRNISATGVIVSFAISVIIAKLLDVGKKRYCKSRQDTTNKKMLWSLSKRCMKETNRRRSNTI